jgi:hypothetical protein
MRKYLAAIAAALTLLATLPGARAQTPCDLPCLITGTAGPQGPQGPEGPPGPSVQGPAGPQGPQGAAGSGGNMIPGGRLTLVSGSPLMSVDTTSTTLYYSPYSSDTFPVLDGTLAWQIRTFSSSRTDQVGAQMSGGSKWAGGQSRDVFGTISGSICTGPSWPGSDLTSRKLTRYAGVLVNSAVITCDTTSITAVSCPQYQCTYLGSINPSVTGQLTAQFSYGQDRKFEVWTAYAQNQVDIVLHVGATNVQYMPTNQYPAFNYFGNPPSSLNGGTFFSGLPTNLDVAYYQGMFINSQSGPSGMIAAVCLNGLVNVGFWAKFSSDTTVIAGGAGTDARYNASAMVGQNKLYMCVAKANTATSTVWGGTPNYAPNYEVNGVMFVRYRG